MDFKVLTENLLKKGYLVTTFQTKDAAREYLNRTLDGTTIGIGGSMTIEELDLFDLLSSHNQVFWHWKDHTPGILMKAACAEVYLSSVNGISEDGVIVNIDGTGNRVASMIYGHQKVYLIVGANKIVKTGDEALARAQNVAAPLNAKRLGRKTPCAIKGDHCYNCQSCERICRVTSILQEKPTGMTYEVVLIDESLGF